MSAKDGNLLSDKNIVQAVSGQCEFNYVIN